MHRHSVYNRMSSGEKAVAGQLTTLGLYWQYESPVCISDERGLQRTWYPDFCLPLLGIYIEVMGEAASYDYRRSIYEKNLVPIFFINPYTDTGWPCQLLSSITDICTARLRLMQQLFVKAA